MVSDMRLTALLFMALAVGCSSEPSSPSTTADAGTDTTETVEDEDTGTPSEDAPATEATWADVYTKVLATRCSGGYCHGGGSGGWTFSDDRAATYAQLVGPSSGSCTGLKKVEPGQPEKSSLYVKMRGSFAGVCSGYKMPSSGGSATAAQLEMVRSWIAAGAKP